MSRRNQKMLLVLLIALVGAITTGSAVSTPGTESQPAAVVSATEWYQVVKVVDGDTFDVRLGSSTVRVRLIGLDTPEVVDPRKPVQCFGKEASEAMKKVTGSGYVRFETDPTQDTYDKYGRLLAYAYVPLSSSLEGLLVNRYMIAEGYGHEYTYDVPYKYRDDFKAAERSARNGQKGLWAPAACAES